MQPFMHQTQNKGQEPVTLCRECHTLSNDHHYACTNPPSRWLLPRLEALDPRLS